MCLMALRRNTLLLSTITTSGNDLALIASFVSQRLPVLCWDFYSSLGRRSVLLFLSDSNQIEEADPHIFSRVVDDDWARKISCLKPIGVIEVGIVHT